MALQELMIKYVYHVQSTHGQLEQQDFVNKKIDFFDFLERFNIDVGIVTETWLRPTLSPHISSILCRSAFNMIVHPLQTKGFEACFLLSGEKSSSPH